MLRKRTRSHHKDQNIGYIMSDDVSESHYQTDKLGRRHKVNPFFHLPGLFVGFSPKSVSNSARSPTSPLERMEFSNAVNRCRFQKSPGGENSKTWNRKKVGLSIIADLDDETKQSEKILRSSDSKNILFGPRMQINTPNFGTRIDYFETPKSLPKNISVFSEQAKTKIPQVRNHGVLFEIGETPLETESFGNILSCSLDSGRSGLHNTSSGNFGTESGTFLVNSSSHFTRGTSNLVNSPGKKLASIPASFASSNKAFTWTLSASEIELSEDYTCVKKYGSNPITIHFFGDCILECHNNEFTVSPRNEQKEISLPWFTQCSRAPPTSHSSNNFLSFCYLCNKTLDGKDIYMYRGEKAFCSWNCRSEEILIEEEMEKNNNSSKYSAKSNNHAVLFETGLFVAT